MSNSQSKFVKQVLVEEGEYDRLRQRQFRDYSPEIRTMVKLQENIFQTMMRDDLDPQQKLELTSGPRQRFNQLREESNTLNGENLSKGSDAPSTVHVKKTEPVVNPQPIDAAAKDEPVVMKNEPVKVAQPKQADKLMDLIGNNPTVIRRNDANEMEVNGHAVPGTNFDELYAALFSPQGSNNMTGMPELIGALRQLNVDSKDIVSRHIQAAYETATPRSGPLRHNDKALPTAPKPAPKTKPPNKNKRQSTAPLETEDPAPSKYGTRSTTKYNMPRKGLSNKAKNEQSGTGLNYPAILYVY